MNTLSFIQSIKNRVVLLSLCFAVLFPFLAASAFANAQSSFKLSTNVKLSTLLEDDRYLGLRQDDATSALYARIQEEVDWQLNKNLKMNAFLEVFTAEERIPLDEEYAVKDKKSYVYLRELWVDYSGFGRYPGESLRFGAERFRESSSLWWDREMVLARWNLESTLLNASAGIGKRTNALHSNEDFLSDDESGRNHAFAFADYQWRYQHWLGAKLHYSKRKEEPVSEQLELTWFGLSAHNQYNDLDKSPWQYSAELIALRGSALSTDITGWAADVGIRRSFLSKNPVSVGVQFAYGSGGGDNVDDRTFYQTDLHTNRSRFAGTSSILSRFGEAAKAELSNISIATVYASQKIQERWEWSIVFHDFKRVNEERSVVLRGVAVTPETQGDQLGNEMDILFGYLGNPSRRERSWDSDFSVLLRAGYFKTGNAFATLPNDGRYRAVIDIQKRF